MIRPIAFCFALLAASACQAQTYPPITPGMVVPSARMLAEMSRMEAGSAITIAAGRVASVDLNLPDCDAILAAILANPAISAEAKSTATAIHLDFGYDSSDMFSSLGAAVGDITLARGKYDLAEARFAAGDYAFASAKYQEAKTLAISATGYADSAYMFRMMAVAKANMLTMILLGIY